MLVKSCAPEPAMSLVPTPLMAPLLDVGCSYFPSTTLHRIKMPNSQEQENEPDCQQQQMQLQHHQQQQQHHQQQQQKLHHQIKRKLTAGRARGNTNNNSGKITEFFQVRRSERKCKRVVLEEKQRDIENKVRCGVEEGLKVKHFVAKGRGVVTTRNFTKGEFVVEYIGDLIDMVTAKKREAKYSKDQNTGCYMYYFQHRNQQYCVDATAESDKLGRLVNHSRNGNLATRIVEVGGLPHLVLIAKKDIPAGSEITYDYGDRSRESIQNYPWLAS